MNFDGLPRSPLGPVSKFLGGADVVGHRLLAESKGNYLGVGAPVGVTRKRLPKKFPRRPRKRGYLGFSSRIPALAGVHGLKFFGRHLRFPLFFPQFSVVEFLRAVVRLSLFVLAPMHSADHPDKTQNQQVAEAQYGAQVRNLPSAPFLFSLSFSLVEVPRKRLPALFLRSF